MIRALRKADHVRVCGESSIVSYNPARRCSSMWMKRSKKERICKGETSLHRHSAPLLLFYPFTSCLLRSISLAFYALLFQPSPGSQRSTSRPCFAVISASFALSYEPLQELCDSMFGVCTAFSVIIRHQRMMYKPKATSYGMFSSGPPLSFSKKKKKKLKGGRKESSLK